MWQDQLPLPLASSPLIPPLSLSISGHDVCVCVACSSVSAVTLAIYTLYMLSNICV